MIFGSFPDGFTYYWLEKFPLVLIHTYVTMQCVAEETLFASYYQGGYKYSVEDMCLQAKEYCSIRGITVDETPPPLESDAPLIQEKKKERKPFKSFKNAGPLKSRNKKAAHKQDEPLSWSIGNM